MKLILYVCLFLILHVVNGNFICDPEEMRQLYEDVRNDDSATTWAVFKYGTTSATRKMICRSETGTNYDDMLSILGDDERAFAYARFDTGDEKKRRTKFAFITWVGPGVSPLKKAKVSTDKAHVKKIMSQFAKEILADEKSELKYNKILRVLEQASGAAYGTGRALV